MVYFKSKIKRYFNNNMIIVSDTKHVLVFMFKQLININVFMIIQQINMNIKDFRMYPKAGCLPEASNVLLSPGLVILIVGDLSRCTVRSRCRKMYAVQFLERPPRSSRTAGKTPGSSRTGSEQSRQTLPKNLIARLSPSRDLCDGRGSEGSALAGTVRVMQAMRIAEKQQTEGEREMSSKQEYLRL